jgi:hypothetical protein
MKREMMQKITTVVSICTDVQLATCAPDQTIWDPVVQVDATTHQPRRRNIMIGTLLVLALIGHLPNYAKAKEDDRQNELRIEGEKLEGEIRDQIRVPKTELATQMKVWVAVAGVPTNRRAQDRSIQGPASKG